MPRIGAFSQRDFDEWIVYRESVRVKHAAIYGNGTGHAFAS